MRKYIFRTLGFFLLVSVLVGCGLTMSTYEGSGFTLKYPSGWTPSAADQSRLVTISRINRTEKVVDGVITLHREPLNGNDAVAVLSNNEVSLRAVNPTLDSSKVKVSGQDGMLWSYEQTVDGQTTIYRQIVFVQNDMIYTVTAAFQGDEADVSDIETSLKSVVIE